MELMNVVYVLFMALIVLGIILFLFPSELMGSVSETLSKQGSYNTIKFLSEPKVSINLLPQLPDDNKLSYEIKIEPIYIKYTGKFESGETEIPIIPIIEFKDKSTFATVTTLQTGMCNLQDSRPCILIKPDQLEIGGSATATITTEIPPIREFHQGDFLIEGEKVYVKTPNNGKYAITAADFYYKIAEKIIDPISPTCWVLFSIENEKESKQISLTDCSEGKCEGVVYFGEGYVKITIPEDKIEKCEKVYPEIEAKPEKTTGEVDDWDLNETVLLSFWKSTPCTANLETFESLKQKCLNNFENDFLWRESLAATIIIF